MPEAANDAGFAMTGSFTCMMLAALLIFDDATDLSQKQSYVADMVLLDKLFLIKKNGYKS